MQGQQYMYKMWEHSQGLPDTVSWMAHVQDNDGNTFITGNTLVAGEKANIITTKYDRSGDEIWQVTYNSTYNDNDYGTAITLDDDGNVYVAAASFISATNQYDYRTIKYNSTGTLQWTSTYNGTGSLYDIPSDIIVDASDNVYVTGGSFGSGTGWDYATIKYNSSGTQQWVSRYNYNGNDDAASGLAINNSGRIVVTGGSAQAVDNWDFASVKYNQNTGVQLDVQRNTASGLGIDRVYGFTIDGDDNIYLTGRAAISGQGYNMRTVKMDSLLTVQWSKTYDAANGDDVGYAVQVDLAGYVYVTGSITNAEGILNGFTVKYNSAGTVQWSAIETANNGSDLATWNTDLSISEDNDIVIAGTTHNGANSDIIMYIYNSDGEKQWTETWNGTGNGDDTPYFVHADFNNQIYIGGKSFSGTNDTYILVRYKQVNYTTPPDDDTDKPIQLTWFENKGQIIDTDENLRSDIKYYTQRHYPALYASDDSLFMVFSRIDTNTTTDDTLARIDIGYYNSSSTKEIHHATSNGGEYLNYFLAHTGAQGITNVQQHEKLYITELYPKVDLMYYFDNAGIKYYLIIKPGYSAQQNPIQMVINGATKTINADTTLTLTTDIGEITFRTPDAYQIDDDGSRIDLGWDATYTSVSDRIGFGLGSYTSSKVLVLEIGVGMFLGGGGGCEPNVIWGTYYQGGENEILSDVKINSNPIDFALYISGTTTTSASEFPSELIFMNDLTGTAYDLIIQKFNLKDEDPTYDKYEGKWAVYVGGSENENYYNSKNCQLSIGNNGKLIYFIGPTYSDDLPVLDNYTGDPDNLFDNDINADLDGCVGLLSSEGNLLWLSYLGGASGNTTLTQIQTKPEGGFLVTGSSSGGTDFPFFDPTGTMPYSSSGKKGFIIEVDPYHHLQMGTLFGSSIYDIINDVSINNSGEIVICGNTSGSSMPVTIGACDNSFAGVVDVFIAKIQSDGTDRDLDWCTYYGGAGTDRANALTIDEDNNVYVTGETYNYDLAAEYKFPLIDAGEYFDDLYIETSVGEHKGFILKTDIDGNCEWATLFGGDSETYCRDITSDGQNIFIVGNEEDAGDDFPLNPSDYSGVYFDDIEGVNGHTSFVSMFNKNTSLRWSTFLGDDAHNGAVAASINHEYRDELYVVGFFSNSYLYSGYLPLCDPGEDAFYDESIAGELNHGFINGFDVNMFEDIETHLTQVEVNSSYNIYPNPTDHLLNVYKSDKAMFTVEIYNLMGKLIYRNLDFLNTCVINVSSFSSGTYLLKITSDTQIANYLFEKL
ncbi:MAG: T9SS type A sorting domain-containing protein [Chitinophagales bacterium]